MGNFADRIKMSNTLKAIIIASLIFTTFAGLELAVQQIEAASLSKPLSSGDNTITFRDIAAENTPISVIGTSDRSGNLIITLEDVDANLDILSEDFTSVLAKSSAHPDAIVSVPVTETDLSTGSFLGTITLSSSTTTSSNLEYSTGDTVELFYIPEGSPSSITDSTVSEVDPLPVPRMSAVLGGVSGGGPHSYTVSDFSMIVNGELNTSRSDGVCPYSIIISPVELELSPGTTATDITVTLSYANADLGGLEPEDLEFGHRKTNPSINVQSTFQNIPYIHDEVAKTFTSLPHTPFLPPLANQYVIGDNIGCSGGGGGGLVRPSLVVNALAGIGGLGGGGADGSPPIVYLADLVKYSHLGIPSEIEQMVLTQDTTPISPMEIGLFEGFDYPMTINDKGFVLGQFSNTIETQTIKTGSTAVIKFILYESTKIQHASLYLNLVGANNQVHQSDTQLLFNDGLDLQKKDPNGLISEATVTINDIDENKKEAVFEITFANEMETSDLIIRSWDPYFNSRDTIILDAIQVVPEIVEESPIPIYEEPVIEELKSQSIPIWVKNNAAWWSEQQIGDNDFVSGIEYLIKNGIISVPGVEVSTGSSSTEIPDWIQNNAGWWADSLISDEDFVEGIQWLITDGVIQI